jgi:hypothetical protein
MLPVVRSLVVIGALSLALSACSDRKENEERLLLDRATRVDHDAPAVLREQQVADLASVVLQTEELVVVRDTCVGGHRALLEAEEEQARAGRELAAISGGDPEAQLPLTKAREVEAAIRSSTEALGRARDLLRRCQEELSALRHRHG